MKKPITKYSNSKKWKLYIVSISLQLWASLITLFTGRKITHAFYYSQEQKNRLEHVLNIFSEISKDIHINTFKGREYTEMRELKHGWSNFKDSKLIGFGSYSDISSIYEEV